GYGIRDDNASVCMAWSFGLLRRALLEGGGRLAASGRLDHPTHVFELAVDEGEAMLRGRGTVTAAEAARRAGMRVAAEGATPPPVLGPAPTPPPDPGVFPSAMAAVTRATVAQHRAMSRSRS